MTDHISNPGTGRFVADILTPLKDRLAILPGSRDRQNRPIIFFPSTETGANSDDLKNVLQYFYFVTSDDCKKNGFLFILGTKKGSTKQSVKPILRSIQDFFPGTVSAVFIIKQDNFLDKLKLNSSSNKYKFDVHDISMENLTRFIDSSQLLKEFGGNLHYDHEEWIELRRDIERTIQKLTECLEECCDVHNKLMRKRHSQEIGWPSGAGIYDEIETKLLKIDSDKCDEMVKIIIKRILSTSDDNYNSAANLKTPNPDLAYIIPNLNHLVKKVVKGKTELLRKWSEDKIEQDRWKQFKIFETDFLSFKEWIVTNTRLVEEYFSSIGNNLTDLQQLIQQNDEIVNSTENSKINLEHVIKIGKIMIENGNSGKGQVEIMLKELDHRWNYFITKLDQRSKLLTNCLQFRIKTEKFFEMNEIWKEKLNNFPDDLKERNLNVLEEDVKEFDKIGSEIEDVYSEAAHETTLLSETMKMQLGNDVGQSESFKLVVGITQRLAREKRTIQNLFETKKEKYCLKLAYEAFLDETPKVMAWLTEYGEPYLSRKTNIGENIEQARLLTKNHEDFQRISSNTYRNAQHLREAGERLRNIPEYNNSIVNNRLIELQNMIDGFTNRVNQRTEILKLSQMFHLHFKEIMKWYDTLSNRTIEYETVPENDDAVEIMIEKLLHENDATRVAFNTVMSESAQLMKSLKQQHEMFGIDITTMKNHIEQITSEIQARHTLEMDREPYQRNCVVVGKSAGSFMMECEDIYQRLLLWGDDLKELLAGASVTTTHHDKLIGFHKQNIHQVEEVAADIETKFNDLLKKIDDEKLNLMDSNGKLFKNVLIEQSRKLTMLENDVLKLANEVTDRIISSRDLSQQLFRAQESRRKLTQYANAIEKLLRSIPADKAEAHHREELFQKLKIGSESTVTEFLSITSVFHQYAEACGNDRNRRNQIMVESNALVTAYERYTFAVEACEKLVGSARLFYTYFDMLHPVIKDLIENSNQQPKDYCIGFPSNDSGTLTANLGDMITKQNNGKEKFLQSSLYFAKTADQFMKAISKLPLPDLEKRKHMNYVNQRKNTIKEKQTKVLNIMNRKLNMIANCQQAVCCRKMTDDILNWLQHDTQVRMFLNDKRTLTELKQLPKSEIENKIQNLMDFKILIRQKKTEAVFLCNSIKAFLKESKESVHANDVQGYLTKIKSAFNNFGKTFAEREELLHLALGDNDQVTTVAERLSDCTLEDKIENNDDTRADRQMRMPMLELIEGEKKYIDLLKMLIIHYLGGYMKAEQDGKLPNSLKNKGMAIFGNVEKVYEFHEKYFLNDLVAYTDNPIDVACAFFNNIERMRDVYTQYIVNKDQNLKFVSSPEVVKFFQELKNNNPQVMAYEKETNQTMNLDSVLMAPIQRIFKYKLLLDRLIEKAPCGVNEIKEVAETIEEIANYANDFIKVLSLEDYKIHASGDFIMSGIFTVTEPKRLLIKREKDYQVFLFENNIVLAKREKDEYSTEKYYFKEKILLSDVFVIVEHIDISNNKFGLRRKNTGNVASNDSTTIFKAENDKIQQRWVKKLRELTMEMQTTNSKKSTTSLDHLSLTPSSSNRNSRASRDSCELSHTTTTTEDGQSLRSQDLPPTMIGMTNNNNKSEQISFRLSQWPNDDGNGS